MHAPSDDLRTQLDALKADVAALNARELATSRVLQAIAAGPKEAVRTLEIIVSFASSLCGADDAVLLLRHDNYLVLELQPINAAGLRAARRAFPAAAKWACRETYRTALSVPLLCDKDALGSITARRVAANRFGEGEMALLQMLADQAVIAIEHARLFEAVESRTREIDEGIAHQSASSEILRAISIARTDAQPVFEMIVRNAVSLCSTFEGCSLTPANSCRSRRPS